MRGTGLLWLIGVLNSIALTRRQNNGEGSLVSALIPRSSARVRPYSFSSIRTIVVAVDVFIEANRPARA